MSCGQSFTFQCDTSPFCHQAASLAPRVTPLAPAGTALQQHQVTLAAAAPPASPGIPITSAALRPGFPGGISLTISNGKTRVEVSCVGIAKETFFKH